MNQFNRAAFIFLLCIAPVSALHAQRAYTVDNDTARLCRVDLTSGAVTVVGPLPGFTGSVLDSEFLGDRLYVLVNESSVKRLLQVDPLTGAILANVPVTLVGSPLPNAVEGLGASNGRLVISLWLDGAPNVFTSNHLGLLETDGQAADPINYPRDFDGLGARSAGGFFAIDRDPSLSTVTLLTATREPPDSAILQTFPFTADLNGVDEPGETRTGVYAFDFVTRRIHRFSVEDGSLISSTPYDSAFRFVTIAIPPRCEGDANDDGQISFPDITAVLGNWGTSGVIGDANGDGMISFPDVTAVLGNWGQPCI